MSVATAATTFAAEWDTWQEHRWSAVSAPYGTAALVETAWLTPQPHTVEGVPGLWRSVGDRIVGEGLDGAVRDAEVTRTDGSPVGDSIELTAGEELRVGPVLLRAFVRDGAPALRRLDPDASTRTALRGIDAYAPDPSWAVEAQFTPRTEPLEIELVDGHRSVSDRTGVLSFTLHGTPRELIATHGPDAISIVFGDTTNGSETYRFRFLRTALPDAEGRTIVDFTRAFLPPCAFSDHYVCPLPPAGNRLDIAVNAGERLPVRDVVGSR